MADVGKKWVKIKEKRNKDKQKWGMLQSEKHT